MGQSNTTILSRDVLASVVVLLVALPLCMGIAVASGVSPVAGLLAGIVGGIVVGLFGGSPLQVSGPAAGLVVIVADIIANHGVSMLGVVVLAAGVLQVVASMFSIGQWFRAVAPAVLHAMLAGIGVLIIASQVHVMIDTVPDASGLTNIAALPDAFLTAFAAADGTYHHHAGLIGLLTLGIMLAWNALKPRMPSKLAMLPAPLVALGTATGGAMLFDLPIRYVEVPTSLAAMVTLPSLSDFAALADPAVIGSVIALAAVASAEALLSAAAVDKLHSGPRTDFDRELMAHGIGNALLGLLGGLPLTGVIVRSSANVEAGATSRWSAVLQGAWLLLTVAVLGPILQAIPVTALAAVLVYIGFKLVNVQAIKQLRERGRPEVAIYAATVVAIVAVSLLSGLILGLVLSLLYLSWKLSHLDVQTRETEPGRVEVELKGAATFVALPTLARALQAIDPRAEVHMYLGALAYVDHACFEHITDWERQRERLGGELVIAWQEMRARAARPLLRRVA